LFVIDEIDGEGAKMFGNSKRLFDVFDEEGNEHSDVSDVEEYSGHSQASGNKRRELEHVSPSSHAIKKTLIIDEDEQINRDVAMEGDDEVSGVSNGTKKPRLPSDAVPIVTDSFETEATKEFEAAKVDAETGRSAAENKSIVLRHQV
jgi:hypothetical protein